MKVSVILLGLLLAAIPAIADITATITGTVTHDGAPLAGVVVRASSPAMQGTRTATTDANGRYAIIAVPPGDYTVAFALGDMSSASTVVHAGLGQTARANAELRDAEAELPGVASSIPAAATTSSVQANIRESIVDTLPGGRDLDAVIDLLAGGQIGGVQPVASSWLLDGGLVVDPIGRGTAALPPPVYVEDAIQETAVLTAAIPPQYGRFAGGVVNVVTRAGGNVWSGSFRDSVSNPSWTEPSPYQNISNTDETDHLFEATLGGSIVRDQLWFFAAGRQWDDTNQRFFVESPSWGYPSTNEDRRWEAKLTGDLLGRHSLMASRFDKAIIRENVCYGDCVEPSALDAHTEASKSITVAQYNGVLTARVVAEAFWSRAESSFEGYGGTSNDPATGTWGMDDNTGGLYGAPVFCENCGPTDDRETSTLGAKISWYLPTARLGTHRLAGGYDHLSSDNIGNNYQSGSGFYIYTYTVQNFNLEPGDVFRPTIVTGDFIAWNPIVLPDRPSDQQMHGLYVNDRWDLSAAWSLDVGVRYDLNDIVDEAGTVVSDAAAVQPRVALAWDVKANGRYRLNASYGQYVDLITTSMGSGMWPGGTPQTLYWMYEGPVVEGLPTYEAFARVFDWFNNLCDAEGHCGTANMGALYATYGSTSNLQIDPSLESTKTTEASLGFSFAPSANAFVRVDAIRREWSNFLNAIVTQQTGQTTDLFGNILDRAIGGNFDDGLEATYKALTMQGAWRFGRRWLLGGTWNWSRKKNNVQAAAAGWMPAADYYPELTKFPMHNPVREREYQALRAWLTYTLPTRFGTVDVSLLESYDTGAPYSLASEIGTGFDPEARENYVMPPQSVGYVFSGSKMYYLDDVTSTDLGVRYQLPVVGRAGIFIDATVANLFNEDAQVGANLQVRTAYKKRCPYCVPFNPFTETPVEGVHWDKGPRFGQATSVSDYQTPRTYLFSAGVRF